MHLTSTRSVRSKRSSGQALASCPTSAARQCHLEQALSQGHTFAIRALGDPTLNLDTGIGQALVVLGRSGWPTFPHAATRGLVAELEGDGVLLAQFALEVHQGERVHHFPLAGNEVGVHSAGTEEALKLLVGGSRHSLDIHLDRLLVFQYSISIRESLSFSYLANVIEIAFFVGLHKSLPCLLGGLLFDFGEVKSTGVLAVYSRMAYTRSVYMSNDQSCRESYLPSHSSCRSRQAYRGNRWHSGPLGCRPCMPREACEG